MARPSLPSQTRAPAKKSLPSPISLSPLALALVLAFGHGAVNAQVVPVGAGTKVTAAQNGVPVVNIAAPNGSGVSNNQYSQFNVGSQGLVLNNSSAPVVTQLGGAIVANPNLSNSSARLILNQVVQGTPSTIDGFVEVGGTAADVVIANPVGITCGGCGFINTPRVTLTTGTPVMDGSGNLSGFNVTGGTITVNGHGLDATGQSYFDVLARAVVVNGQVNGQDLQIVGGAENFNYANRTAAAIGGASGAPQFAIDSTALGGMYANRITLISTEAGVGVRLLGDVASTAAGISISSAGDILLAGKVSAQTDLAVNYSGSASAGAITIDGGSTQSTVGAGGNMTLVAGAGGLSFGNAIIGANGNTTLSGASLTDTGGSGALRFASGTLDVNLTGGASIAGATYNGSAATSLIASSLTLANGASITSARAGADSGNVSVSTTGAMSVAGAVAGNGVTLTSSGSSIAVTGEVGGSSSGVTLAALNGISVAPQAGVAGSGQVQSAGAITIEGTQSGTIAAFTDAAGSVVKAGANLTFEGAGGGQALSVDNVLNATIGAATLTADAQTFVNAGVVQADSGATLAVGTFTNASGSTATPAKFIGATTNSPVSITAGAINNTGIVQSAGSLVLSSTGATTNSGDFLATGNLGLTVGANTFTNAGTIQSGSALTINSPNLILTNSDGQATDKAYLHGATVNLDVAAINNYGSIQGDTSTSIVTGTFNNETSSALLAASTGGTTGSNLTATTWNNNGAIFSVAPLTLTVGQTLNNTATGGIVGGVLAIQSLPNSATSTVNNAGNALIFGQTSLSITGFHAINNGLTWVSNASANNPYQAELAQPGEIESSGILTLSVNTNSGVITNNGYLYGDSGVNITAAQFNNVTVAPQLVNNPGAVAAGLTSYGFVPNSATYPSSLDFGSNSPLTIAQNAAPELIASPQNQPQVALDNVILGAFLSTYHPNGSTTTNTSQFFQVPNAQSQFLQLEYGANAISPALALDFTDNGVYRAWSGQVYAGKIYDATPLQAQVISQNGDVNITIGSALGASTNTGGLIEAGHNINIGLATGSAAATFNSTTINQSGNVYNANGIEEWTPVPVGLTPSQTPVTVSWAGGDAGYYELTNPLVSQPVITSGVVGTTSVVMVGSTMQAVNAFNSSGISFNNGTGSVGSISGPYARGRSVGTGGTTAAAGSVSIGGLSLALPSNPNGLFIVDLAPGATYLIESNPKYTSLLSPGLGSNYLIEQLGLNPNTTEERLGDPSYEDYLVQQEVIAQTGLALIDGASNSEGLMQNLMTSAVWEASHLNLTLGVALTQAQINNLQQDMVWLVSTTVDGHTVLEPVVYLASSTRSSSSLDTATITANSIAISGGNTFSNTGGTVTATNGLNIQTTGDINNTNGTISGGNVGLTSTTGNINNTTTAQTFGDSANYTQVAATQASINSTGDLNIAANKGNITSTGSAISATGNAALSAGGDVTLQNQVLTTQTTTHTSSGNWLTGESSTTIVTDTQTSNASTLTSGGNLSITAGNNINVVGSQAQSGGNVTANAQNINISNGTTTDSQTVHTSSSGFGASGMSVGYSSNTSDSSTTVTNVVASSLTGTGSVTLNGTQSVNVTGSDVAAGNNLNVNTANLNTSAAQNTVAQTTSSSGWGVGVSVAADTNSESIGISGSGTNSSGQANSSTARVSTLTSGGNMNLNSPGGTISQQGTQIAAGGNFNQNAGTITYTAAQSTNSSNSTSTTIGAGISTGANYNAGNFVSQAQQLQDPNVGAPNVMAQVGGSYSTQSASQNSTTATVATITAHGNVNSTSTGATNLEGTQIQSGNQTNISAGSLNVTAAADTTSSSSSSMTASGGIQGGLSIQGKPVGGGEGAYGNSNANGSSSTAVVGSITSNGGTNITTTSGDANFTGTQLASGGATTITSAGNINFNQANNTSSSQSSSQSYSGSVGTNANGTGSNAQASGSAGQSSASGSSSTAVAGSITSTGGITVAAGQSGNLTMQGTQLQTPGSIALSAGGNVALDAATSTSNSSNSSWNASASGSKGTSKGDAQKDNTGAGGSSGSGSFSVANGNSSTTTQTGGTLNGRNISITSGGDTSMTGTQIAATGGVNVNVGGNLSMQSAQTTTSSSQTGYGGSLGATTPAKNPNAGSTNGNNAGAGNIGANYSNASGSSVTNQNANITGGNVVVNTGGNATLAGAHIGGANVTTNVGGNLSITSVADTSNSSSVAGQGYLGYAAPTSSSQGRKGFSGGSLADGVSGSGSSSSSNSTMVAQASGIQGGSSTTVNVLTGNTNLVGAAVGSTGGTTALNTKTLTTGSVAESSGGSSMSAGAGLSVTTQQVPGYSSSTQPSTSATLASSIGGQPIGANVAVSAVSTALNQPKVQSAIQLQRGLQSVSATYGENPPPAVLAQLLSNAGVAVPANATPEALVALANSTLSQGRTALSNSLTNSQVPQSQVQSLVQTLSLAPQQ